VLLEALVGDTERGEPLTEEVGVTVAVLLEGFRGGVERRLRKRVKRSSRWERVASRSGVRADVRRPGYRVRRVVSSAGVTRRRTLASLRARVSALSGRTSARSTRVRAGVVTGMP
jgi:hypothetical protein